jgi:maltooligosyltrehalose trehalohydrolase
MHEGVVAGIGPGARYRLRLDDGPALPDPCSRFQPKGVHGPSEVVDPAFAWTDEGWPGLSADGLAIYELHVGTYTPEGTFRALISQLAHLRELGVNAIELMPVAAFPGERGWGYDGVALWAPFHPYGRPEDLKALVDAAHGHGLGIILDVVYNHLGPDGNFLRAFAGDYFTDRHHTPWGEAINFDGPNNRFVRDFILGNALLWLDDYHMDGLRLDATHAIIDDSPLHILAELNDRLRAEIPRGVVLIAEDERRDPTPIRDRDGGGHGLDAVWADGFHHELHVRLTGERSSYFAGYVGSAEGIANAIRGGFITSSDHDGDGIADGDASPGAAWLGEEPARSFVFCTQNHDQVGNRAFGERLEHLVGREAARMATAIQLFAPETPLLFMGEEFAASAPFQYFTDHEPALGKLVSEGREREFGGLGRAQGHPDPVPDPQAEATFLRSKLDLSERETNAPMLALYTELLRLRREDPVLRVQDRARTRAAGLSAAVLAVHRWTAAGNRLLLANTEREPVRIAWENLPRSLGLPKSAAGWVPLLSTGEARFGGSAGLPTADADGIALPGMTAVVLGREG